MKTIPFALNLATAGIALALLGTATHAQGRAPGDRGGNGGDVCEHKIDDIRKDIESWIVRGGAARLSLAKFPGLTRQEYERRMLEQLRDPRIVVSCEKVAQKVLSADKTCRNFVDEAGKDVFACDVDRFMDPTITPASKQYFLVHHEFAGLAKIEVNRDEKSNYDLSEQISGFVTYELVPRLAIAPDAAEPASISLSEIPAGSTLQALETIEFPAGESSVKVGGLCELRTDGQNRGGSRVSAGRSLPIGAGRIDWCYRGVGLYRHDVCEVVIPILITPKAELRCQLSNERRASSPDYEVYGTGAVSEHLGSGKAGKLRLNLVPLPVKELGAPETRGRDQRKAPEPQPVLEAREYFGAPEGHAKKNAKERAKEYCSDQGKKFKLDHFDTYRKGDDIVEGTIWFQCK
jgi:hypothetical protein